MTPPMGFGTGRIPGGGAGADGAHSADRLSPESFAREFEAGFRALWCIAAGVLGDRSRAADVVQDAAIVALRRLNDFQPGTSFLAWMGRIVRFTAINERRKTIRHRTSPAEPSMLDHSGAAPQQVDRPPVLNGRGEVLESSGAFDDRVLAALSNLTEQARACLLLRTVLDMPYKEIALALDIPEGTAMSHVHRARRSMRAELADWHDGEMGERGEQGGLGKVGEIAGGPGGQSS